MGTSIDNRVVEMKFDNSNFERNVKTSMSTIDKLKEKLHFKGVKKGFEEINNAAKNVNMQDLGNRVDSVKVNFSGLEVFAIAALTRIANKAIDVGQNVVKSLTFGPMMDGFGEYETQMGAIQTILANTMDEGTNVKQVNNVLDDLNDYADKTIYNFTEMTKNIGTFTAAGVKLKDSASSIKGIANLAAMSGSTSQQASVAMYQLSQALASGTVKLQDWNSVVNAGMGGKVFQRALEKTSREMNTGVDGAIKKYGTFRESLKAGWLTSEVLTETLNKMTVSGANEYLAKNSDLSVDAIDNIIKSKKSYEEAAQAISEHSRLSKEDIQNTIQLSNTAEKAATQVKTFTQLRSTIKEALGSQWTESWRYIIGDFDEAKQLFTGISDYIGDIISKSGKARNDVLKTAFQSKKVTEEDWNKLGKLGSNVEEAIKNWARTHNVEIDKMIDKHKTFAGSLQEGWLSYKDLNQIIIDSVKGVGNATDNAKPSLEEFTNLAQKVIRGDFGNGEERKKKLAEIGKDYETVQNIVNKTLKGEKVTIEDLKNVQEDQIKTTDAQKQAFIDLYNAMQDSNNPAHMIAVFAAMTAGRDLLLDALKELWNEVERIFGAIHDAFIDIFPPLTGEQLYDLIKGFDEFAKKCHLSDDNLAKLKNTFKGVFAVIDFFLKIGIGAIKGGFSVLKEIFDKFHFNLLDITSGISDWIQKIRDTFNKSGIMSWARGKFSQAIDIIANAWNKLNENEGFKKFKKNFSKGFKDFTSSLPGNIKKAYETIEHGFKAFSELPIVKDLSNAAWDKITKFFTNLSKFKFDGTVFTQIKDAVKKLYENLKKLDKFSFKEVCAAFQEFGNDIWKAIEGPFDKIMTKIGDFTDKSINWIKNLPFVKDLPWLESLLSKAGDSIRNFFKIFANPLADIPKDAPIPKEYQNFVDNYVKKIKSKNIFADIWKFFTDNVNKLIDDTAGALKTWYDKLKESKKTFQQKFGDEFNKLVEFLKNLFVKAIKIVGTVAILKGLWDLKKFIGQIVTIIGGVANSVAKLNKSKAFKERCSGIKEMALALALVAGSIYILGEMDKAKLEQGCIVAGSIAGGIIVFTGIMSAINKFLGKKTSFDKNSILGLGVCIAALGYVVKSLGEMKPEDLDNGIKSVKKISLIFVGLIAAIKLIDSKSSGSKFDGKSFFGLATCIGVMAYIVKKLGELDLATIGKGEAALTGIGVILGALTAVINKYGNFSVPKGSFLGLGICVGIMAYVVKKLGELDLATIGKGESALAGIGLILGALTAVINKYGNFSVPKGSFLGLGICVGIMAYVVSKLGELDNQKLEKGLGALTGIGLILGALTAVINKYGNFSVPKGSFLGLGICVGIMAYVVSKLGELDLATIGKGELALTGIGGILGGLSFILNKFGGFKINKGSFITLSLCIAILSGCLYALSGCDWKGLAGASAGLLALSGCMTILSRIKGMSKKAMASIAVLSLVVGGLTACLYSLKDIPAKQSLGNSAAISLALVSIAGVCTLLSKVQMNIAGVVNGSLSMGAFVTILGAFMAGLGALYEYVPGCKKFLENGVQVLKLIGTGLGEFFGGIVGGFLDGATSTLPKVSKSLSDFMNNLKPFIEGCRNIKSSDFDGIGALSGAILKIVGTDFIKKFLDFFSGGDSIDKFSADITKLGVALKTFSLVVSGIDAPQVQGCIDCLKGLADVKNALPPEKGVFQAFTGYPDVEGFCEQIPMLGKALNAFAGNVSNVNIPQTNGCINCLKGLTDVKNALPKEKGVFQVFTGYADLDQFSTDIPKLGVALNAFAGSVSNINIPQTSGCIGCLQSLEKVKENLPKDNGIFQKIAGYADLGDFSKGIKSLGLALKNFSSNISDVNIPQTEGAIKCIDELRKIKGKLDDTGGLLQFFSGKKDLGKFGEEIGKLASGLSNFKTKVTDIKGSDAEEVSTFVEKMNEAVNKLSTFIQVDSSDNNIKERIGAFETALGKLKDCISGDGNKIDTTYIDGIVSSFGNLKKGISDLVGITIDTSKIDGLSKSITDLGSSLDKASDLKTKMKSIGTNIIQGLIDGITNGNTQVSSAINNVINGIVNNIAGKSSVFTTAGTALVNGLCTGINNGFTIVSNTVSNLVNSINNSVINKQGQFQSSGSALVSSLVSGISSKSSSVSNAMTTVINGGLRAVNDKKTSFQSAGSSLVSSISSGINSKSSSVSNAMTSVANGGLRAVNDKKTSYQSAGSSLASKIASGINNSKSSVTSALSSLVSTAPIREKYNSFYNSGVYLVQGFVNGISNNISSAASAAASMASSASRAARNNLKIHSPSRVFYEIGNYVVKGFANAIDDGNKIVKNSSEEMGSTAINSIKDTIKILSNISLDSIDNTPVIRPVLDLSDVNSKARTINSLFSTNQAIKISNSMSKNRQESSNNNYTSNQEIPRTFQFTQNNYSPKALSRIEIYRQTRNQFTAFERMLQQ